MSHAARASLRGLLVIAVLLASAGCELTEVVGAGGEDIVVVEAVLRTGVPVQKFLLHRTLDGNAVGGVPGASISVMTPEGEEIRFVEDELQACLLYDTRRFIGPDSFAIRASCYRSPDTARSWVLPGGEYELRIETVDGERLRGRTQVPGAFGFRSPAPPREPGQAPVCTIPPNTPFTLVWSSSTDAWVYLIDIEIFGLSAALDSLDVPIPDPLSLTGISISETDTTLVLPAEAGLFERAEYPQELLRALQQGFPEGVQARIIVSALDRNFVNAVRGGSFNPSGNVRISSVVGDGVGVFGSLVPRKLFIEVRRDDAAGSRCAPQDDN